jgi:hypothetical protein
MPVETIDTSSQDGIPVGSDKERKNLVETTVRASTCHALNEDKPKFSRVGLDHIFKNLGCYNMLILLFDRRRK